MDAYSYYIMKLSEARVDELRRQAAEYAISRNSRRSRSRLLLRLRRASARVAAPVTVLGRPTDEDERELSRSA